MSVALEAAQLAHDCAGQLGRTGAVDRSRAIRAAAQHVDAEREAILRANSADIERAREAGMEAPLLDRLMLNDERIDSIVDSMRSIADQADPLDVVLDGHTLDNGVRIERVTVPLGVVAMIYEARPNVTADAVALCLRSGNACVLRGGSAAHDSCKAIADACRRGVVDSGLQAGCIGFVDSTDRAETSNLMHANGLVDVLIPRGSGSLIRACVEGSTVPVIETGQGNCHIYLNESADVDMARDIVVNAKCSRPGVCNAAESLLVDNVAATKLLGAVLPALHEHGVELVGDDTACDIAAELGVPMSKATDDDWGREYLDLKMSVTCVSGVDEAVAHINTYGTRHSECIVTSNYAASETFLAGVDAAAVYVNASTRFTDGGVFGLGGEIGISTQKLHARGPMGAKALVTSKYLIRGEGQVR